jgi:hypothetical protein
MTSTHFLQPCLIAAIFSEKHELQDNLHAGQLFRWRALGQMPSSPASESVSTLVLSIHHQGIWMISTRLRRDGCATTVSGAYLLCTKVELLPFDEPLIVKDPSLVQSPTPSTAQLDGIGWPCLPPMSALSPYMMLLCPFHPFLCYKRPLYLKCFRVILTHGDILPTLRTLFSTKIQSLTQLTWFLIGLLRFSCLFSLLFQV